MVEAPDDSAENYSFVEIDLVKYDVKLMMTSKRHIISHFHLSYLILVKVYIASFLYHFRCHEIHASVHTLYFENSKIVEWIAKNCTRKEFCQRNYKYEGAALVKWEGMSERKLNFEENAQSSSGWFEITDTGRKKHEQTEKCVNANCSELHSLQNTNTNKKNENERQRNILQEVQSSTSRSLFVDGFHMSMVCLFRLRHHRSCLPH